MYVAGWELLVPAHLFLYADIMKKEIDHAKTAVNYWVGNNNYVPPATSTYYGRRFCPST